MTLFHVVMYPSSLLQTEALRQGLLQVVPQAFVDLLTWQELERVICGDPEVSVEALKRTSKYTVLHASLSWHSSHIPLSLKIIIRPNTVSSMSLTSFM